MAPSLYTRSTPRFRSGTNTDLHIDRPDSTISLKTALNFIPSIDNDLERLYPPQKHISISRTMHAKCQLSSSRTSHLRTQWSFPRYIQSHSRYGNRLQNLRFKIIDRVCAIAGKYTIYAERTDNNGLPCNYKHAQQDAQLLTRTATPRVPKGRAGAHGPAARSRCTAMLPRKLHPQTRRRTLRA
jgi:hypothetical protein